MARMGFAVRDAGTPLPMRSVADARRRGGGRRVGGSARRSPASASQLR